ncbi:unnamed protein product [Oppiella nova]|uniref:Uncharacterized protein n=1 Tax=Oppiella nova TaxID=334625 RepID=A0A7R9LCI8_9ACAR|nr:unnamed protein product [Oppiella nova]CAG2162231.1 unnamed protein product [Oppiella nova]
MNCESTVKARPAGCCGGYALNSPYNMSELPAHLYMPVQLRKSEWKKCKHWLHYWHLFSHHFIHTYHSSTDVHFTDCVDNQCQHHRQHNRNHKAIGDHLSPPYDHTVQLFVTITKELFMFIPKYSLIDDNFSYEIYVIKEFLRHCFLTYLVPNNPKAFT